MSKSPQDLYIEPTSLARKRGDVADRALSASGAIRLRAVTLEIARLTLAASHADLAARLAGRTPGRTLERDVYGSHEA